MKQVFVWINEEKCEFSEKISLKKIKEERFEDSDLCIVNGFPVDLNYCPQQNDRIVFIKKGKIPESQDWRFQLYARHTPGVQKILEQSIVGIAGLGGLGSVCSLALARTGVGTLVLADYDYVEPSNLNRQQYFYNQIGMTKTSALADIIAMANPYVSVVPHFLQVSADNYSDIFGMCDVIVEAFDSVESKAMILEAFQEYSPDKYLVMASGMAGYYSSLSVSVKKLSKRVYVAGDFEHGASPGNGLMAPRVGLTASMQANTVLRILMNEFTP